MIQAPKVPITLIFDGDRSLTGLRDKCSLCGHVASAYVRIREKPDKKGEYAQLFGHVCPTCVARMAYQLERLSWWDYVKTGVLAAFKKLVTERAHLAGRSQQTLGYFNLITEGRNPKPKKTSAKELAQLDKAIKLFPRE